jgi:hypothetical protein
MEAGAKRPLDNDASTFFRDTVTPILVENHICASHGACVVADVFLCATSTRLLHACVAVSPAESMRNQ